MMPAARAAAPFPSPSSAEVSSMPGTLRRRAGLALAFAFICAVMLSARGQPPSTVPPNGLRDNPPGVHALVNAKILPSAGKTIEKGTLVLRDGVIVAIGEAAD